MQIKMNDHDIYTNDGQNIIQTIKESAAAADGENAVVDIKLLNRVKYVSDLVNCLRLIIIIFRNLEIVAINHHESIKDLSYEVGRNSRFNSKSILKFSGPGLPRTDEDGDCLETAIKVIKDRCGIMMTRSEVKLIDISMSGTSVTVVISINSIPEAQGG